MTGDSYLEPVQSFLGSTNEALFEMNLYDYAGLGSIIDGYLYGLEQADRVFSCHKSHFQL